MKSFAAKFIDPGSYMGEVLFGLIMTLTFTLGASLVIQEEGREGARAMLIGIVGCNIAWGIIDGVLYVLGILFERGRMRRVGFEVRDQGPGIAEELREKIFQPFFTRREGGVGLGLTLVQRVVREHGGRLSVESEVGKGSVFRVELPAAERET